MAFRRVQFFMGGAQQARRAHIDQRLCVGVAADAAISQREIPGRHRTRALVLLGVGEIGFEQRDRARMLASGCQCPTEQALRAQRLPMVRSQQASALRQRLFRQAQCLGGMAADHLEIDQVLAGGVDIRIIGTERGLAPLVAFARDCSGALDVVGAGEEGTEVEHRSQGLRMVAPQGARAQVQHIARDFDGAFQLAGVGQGDRQAVECLQRLRVLVPLHLAAQVRGALVQRQGLGRLAAHRDVVAEQFDGIDRARVGGAELALQCAHRALEHRCGRVEPVVAHHQASEHLQCADGCQRVLAMMFLEAPQQGARLLNAGGELT